MNIRCLSINSFDSFLSSALPFVIEEVSRHVPGGRHVVQRTVEKDASVALLQLQQQQIRLLQKGSIRMDTLLFTCFYMLAGFCFADIEVPNVPPPPSRELNVEKLNYYVNTDEGKGLLFSEFLSIKGGKRRPWTVAEQPENLPKNRYDDLLAYDETRVKLEPRSYDESDYINANYIDGYHRQKEYVATQGPLPNTTRDFWAMIWQLDIKKIVMLANLFEHGTAKVAKYWPDDSHTYGDITVTKLSEHVMPDIKHVVRIFSVKKSGSLGFRTVRHFHFTGWPDLGVPEDRLDVLGLLQQVRKYRPDSTEPICVHCSAGVGRTGTVILMDSMIERAKAEGVVNFPERLDHMRVQRVDVVEKKEQYVFAHQGVNDLFNSNRSVQYLKQVDQLHSAIDSELYKEDFKVPLTMEEALQRIKWHNHRITAIIGVIDRGFSETP